MTTRKLLTLATIQTSKKDSKFEARLKQEGECLEYQGYCHPRTGYCLIMRNAEPILAHRHAYQLAHGPIPDGLIIRHSCDNRRCCNPAHLLPGTHQDNTDDMRARGRERHAAGEEHANAKLTSENVKTIRELLQRGYGLRGLGRMFSVSHKLISNIKNGAAWKCIALVMVLCLTGCTITQTHETTAPAAIGNDPNGGYVGMLWTGGKFNGYLFKPGAVDRYNGLIGLYGGAPQTINNESIGFVPPLKANAGVTAMAPGLVLQVMHEKILTAMPSDGLFLFDREHADDYKMMRWWQDNGVPRQTYLRSLLP